MEEKVFVMIRRRKSTIVTVAQETAHVKDMKRAVEDTLHVSPSDQQLWLDGMEMDDEKTLAEYSLTNATTQKAIPAPMLMLATRTDQGEFEPNMTGEIRSNSAQGSDVMKPHGDNKHSKKVLLAPKKSVGKTKQKDPLEKESLSSNESSLKEPSLHEDDLKEPNVTEEHERSPSLKEDES